MHILGLSNILSLYSPRLRPSGFEPKERGKRELVYIGGNHIQHCRLDTNSVVSIVGVVSTCCTIFTILDMFPAAVGDKRAPVLKPLAASCHDTDQNCATAGGALHSDGHFVGTGAAAVERQQIT